MSIHSSRGGTGKTLLATNLATLFAQKGRNVVLLDLDFRAPSLTGVFSKIINPPIKCYLNAYLDGRCPAEDALTDISTAYGLNGKFLVGFSDPDVNAIKSIVEKSRAWEVSSVKRLFLLRNLFDEMNIDYCIYDTTPGIQYTAINAAVSSDLSIVVTTFDSLDLQSTKKMLSELYDPFERKTVVLLNKVFPEKTACLNQEKTQMIKQIEETLKRPVIGAIPCFCGVLQTDRTKIMAIEQPNHPFIKELEEVKNKITNNL